MLELSSHDVCGTRILVTSHWAQNQKSSSILGGRPLSSGSSIMLADERLQIAHRYVLFNTDIVYEYQE
jgi:hypothetical protein